MLTSFQFSSVAQYRVWLLATPWTAAHQASLFITNSQTLLKLMSIESVMPSNHLILCRPLLLLPSIFPSMRVFSNESVLRIRWPKYLSFSFSISPSNEYSGLISLKFFTFLKKYYFWFKWRTHSVCIQIHAHTHTHTHTHTHVYLYGHTQQSKILYCFYLFILLPTPHSTWDLSSPVGMEPLLPALRAEAQLPGRQGRPPALFLNCYTPSFPPLSDFAAPLWGD